MQRMQKGKIFKLATTLIVITMLTLLLVACGNGEETTAPADTAPAATPVPAANDTNDADDTPPAVVDEVQEEAGSVMEGAIHVITREAGSGTRGAFIEVTGIESDGEDRTWDEAIVETGTGSVITSVAGNPSAMGYISLGALRDDVRALPINGVEATVDNVQNGSYPLFRTFYMAVPFEVSELAQDFIDFVLSAEGQAIVEGSYIPAVTSPAPFSGGGLTGTLEIEGSTSVAPLMGQIAEAYMELNPGVTIDVHSTGSGAGITGAIEGRVDIGMSSRSLRDTELEEVDAVVMNHDGIAVIVHPTNTIASVTTDEIRDIFMGLLTRWEAIG